MEERLGNKSIKTRFIRNLLFVLLVAYVATVVILLTLIRNYFYNTFENTIRSRINTRAEYYRNTYAPYSSLVDNLYVDRDSWWNEPGMRVQIFDVSSKLLLDSYADLNKDNSAILPDVKKISDGITRSTIYYDKTTGEHVISVITPLMSSDNIVGSLVFTSGLKQLDANIIKIGGLFFLIGGVVSSIAAFLGVILANRLINPIYDLTKTTQEMARGNYSVRNIKTYNDEIGYLSDNFNTMANEIKKKEDLKNEFISSVSHELRTPLTAIKGWAITLKDPSSDRELIDTGLGIIEEESDRLRLMVEELLDFSSFVSGKIKLNVTLIDPEDLIKFLKGFLNERSERENKKFKIVKSNEIKPFYGDFNRIKQVLINLTENSFRFTKEGDSISLIIRQDSLNTYFTVIDTGIGIPSHELSKVKEKFFKGKHSKSQNGIGLSICEEIAKIHGGELLISSRYGEGTSVRFIIPREVREDDEEN